MGLEGNFGKRKKPTIERKKRPINVAPVMAAGAFGASIAAGITSAETIKNTVDDLRRSTPLSREAGYDDIKKSQTGNEILYAVSERDVLDAEISKTSQAIPDTKLIPSQQFEMSPAYKKMGRSENIEDRRDEIYIPPQKAESLVSKVLRYLRG